MNGADGQIQTDHSSVRQVHKDSGTIHDEEFDLISLVGILWRRRALFVAIVSVVLSLAVIYCIMATPRYEIIAQIRPGITGFDEKGNPVREWTAKDIESWFLNEGYSEYMANLIGNSTKTPEIKAVASRDATVITIRFFWPDPEEGKELLTSIINTLSNPLIKAEKKSNKASLKNNLMEDATKVEHVGKFSRIEREKRFLEKQIESIQKRITQSEEQISYLNNQIDVINKNTKELMGLRQELVKNDSDKLAMLMYSNIIQQNISYVSQMEQELTNNIMKVIQFKVAEAGFEKKFLSLGQVELISSPFGSPKPNRPDKVKLIALASIMGVFLALISIFFREFWHRNKARLRV